MATQFNLRCSEEEKNSWEKKAHSEGAVLSAWLRALANEACGEGYRGGPEAVREPAQPKQPRRAAVAPVIVKPISSHVAGIPTTPKAPLQTLRH